MPRIISRIIDQDDFFGVPSSGQVIIYDNVGSGILGFKTGNVVTSVSGTGTVSGLTLTGTVTNSGSLTLGGTLSAISLVSGVTGTLPIAKGGTNLTALGTANQVLAVNAGATALAYVTPTSGTVTSVSGAGTVSGLTLTGTVTSSGSLTLGGTLSAISLTSGVSGTLPVANGGTGVTTSTGTTNVVLSNSPTLVTPLSNSLSAVPVTSGAGNSVTIAAGSGIGTGSGANLILNPGEFATSGTRGSVLIDGLTVGQGKVSGVGNTVVGIGALGAITTGVQNTAIGFNALSRATLNSYNNVAIGNHALYGNARFEYNVAIGMSALGSVYGNNNIGIGGHAGEQGGSGSGSIYIGAEAGRYAAANNNVVVGSSAGFTWNPTGTNLTSGASNVLIGALINIGTGNSAASNSIIIGANAVGNGSNTTTIGNSSTTATYLYGTISAIPVTSGAGNSLTIAAGSGVTSGAGGSLILQAGLQAATGGDGKVIVKQVAGQTGNLLEVQNSAGTVLTKITNSGSIHYGSPTTNTGSAVNIKVPSAGGSSAINVEWPYSAATVFSVGQQGETFTTALGIQTTIGVGGTYSFNLQSPTPTRIGARFAGQPGQTADMVQIFTGGPAAKGLIVQGAASQTANLQEWQNSAGTVLASVSAAGSLEIYSATTADLLKLTVGANANAGILFQGGGTSSSLAAIRAIDASGYNGDLAFYTDNDGASTSSLTERMRILSAGNVGIGTTSPSARTHIVTAAATKGLIVQGASAQTANLQEWQNSAGTVLASVDAAGKVISNALAAIPVTSGAGNSLTIAAGSGVTSGAGGSLILQAGIQATTGGDGSVVIKQLAGQSETSLLRVQSSSNVDLYRFDYSSSGNKALSIGIPTTLGSNGSLQVGLSTVGGNQLSTVIGNTASSTGSNGTVVGFGASSVGGGAALGRNASTTTGVAIGESAVAGGGIAIGWGAVGSSGSSSCVQIGNNSVGTSQLGVAIGHNSSLQYDSIAIGSYANTSTNTAYGSIALGHYAKATAQNQFVIKAAPRNNYSTLSYQEIAWQLGILSNTEDYLTSKARHEWAVFDTATRTGRSIFYTYYTTTAQEGIRIQSAVDQARVAVGGNVISGTRTVVYTGLATEKGLVIQGAASQTANLQEWQNSAGTALASVDAAGNFSVAAITSGTWNGTAITVAKGGTNLTALGTANQVLAVNAGATALAYVTPTSGTVTSVAGAGTVSGLTLTGTVTSTGSLTLGGTLSAVTSLNSLTGGLSVVGGANITVTTAGSNITIASSAGGGTQTINTQTGTTYTFVLADAQALVTFGNASATTVTVPLNSSVAFPVGTGIDVLQLGAGIITFSPSSGVTLNGTPGLKTRVQYSGGTLIKVGTDSWVIVGDTAL